MLLVEKYQQKETPKDMAHDNPINFYSPILQPYFG